jgi:hypothetical protein
MTPVPIPFPATSAPGRGPQDTAGRLINCYAEREAGPAGDRLVWHRAPGLTQVANPSGRVNCRGLFAGPAGTLFAAYNNRLLTFTKSGGVFTGVDRGVFSGTLPVTIARNNKAPTPDIVAVTEDGAFSLFTGANPTSFADADLPVSNSVSFFSGYFIFTIRDGRIFASGLNDVTVDALSFTRADFRADDLLRGVAFGDQFFAFGASSIQVYRDVGTSPFPLSFVGAIPRGLASQFAVAGFEEGWSNELLWVGDDRIVYKLSGITPQPVSTLSVNRDLEALVDPTELRASVYMSGGHAFWSLSCNAWTWVYDLTNDAWHERQSYGRTRWRGASSVRFDNQWIVGDDLTGELYTVSIDNQREHISPLVSVIESDRAAAFPARAVVPRTDFNFTAGVGISNGLDPIQTDPRASISYSNDGGATWSDPVLREIGRGGEYGRRASVTRTGLTGPYGRKWRLSISDPVPLSFRGGVMMREGRAS